ncbi:hypothetical protein AAC387_Pa11g1725 [Persea americana]
MFHTGEGICKRYHKEELYQSLSDGIDDVEIKLAFHQQEAIAASSNATEATCVDIAGHDSTFLDFYEVDAFEVGKGFGWEKEEDFEDDVEREAGNSVLLFHGTRFLGNRFSLSLSLS